MRSWHTSIAVGASIALVGLTATADAGWRRAPENLDRGYVIAESRHGNGTVRGAVRHTRLGPQVQLPGGTWEYCRRLCSETLRVESIDFWDSRQDGVVSDECGVFGCLTIERYY